MSLKIFLLGQFKLSAHTKLIALPSRPAQSLLAYLVLNTGVTQRREKLAGLLWPEATESNARAYLRQALWRIRKSLESASLSADDYLIINDLDVTFNDQAGYWCDVDGFLAPTENQPVTAIIEQVRLYQGDLLPGFYDEWILLERDRLQAILHQKMNMLLNGLLRKQKWEEVLNWGEEWIRIGYAPEPAYRALLQAYTGLGDMGMVCATYQRCVEALDRDLGLEPSPETRILYAEICQGEREEMDAFLSSPARIPEQQPPFLEAERPQPAQPPIFVARENELAQLHQFLQMAATGKGQVVFVTGEAGSGKTALINEFARQAHKADPDLIIAIGNCSAHTGIGDPYLPFREIMEQLTGDVDAQWAAGKVSQEQAELLWNLLPLTTQAIVEAGPRLINSFVPSQPLLERARTHATHGADWLSRLEKLVAQNVDTTFDPNLQQSDLFEQYARVCQILARKVILVLLIDDLQWADLGSTSLLFHLGRHIVGHRLLIVGAYRPEDVALGRDGTRHPLDPVVNEFKRLFGDIIVSVDQAQRRDFTEALLDSEPNRLGAAFREMLFQQTRGHPLFTIELLREMQERNELVQDDDGRWVEGASLAWEAMPARVEAVIAERISRLPDPLQAVLRTASVEGETFTAEVVARVRATDERELLEKLSSDLDRRHRLLRGQSIQRINGQLLSRYRFRHILIQKYLYSSLNEVERINLHNQVGRTLEELYDQRGEKAEIAPQLARHFQEARIMEKAIQYLHQAGNKAVSLSAYREGINQLTKALELLETLPPSPARDEQELDLQLSLGMAWMGDIPSPEWGNTYTRARELCQQIEKIPQLCHVLGHLAIYHYVRAEYQQARAIAEEALTLAQKSQDPILEILEHWHLGFILFGVGDFISAHTHLQKVISFYEPKKHHPQFLRLWGSDPGVSAQAYDACCLWCLGYPDQAAQVGQRATALADEFDHAFTLADVEAFAGCLLNEMRRDAPALKISAEKLIHLSQVIGFLTWFGTGTCYVGEALVIDGQFGEGIAWIQRGKSFRLARGARCYLSGTLGLLAEAQKEANSLAEGLIAISEALAFVEETGERHQEAELVRLQGTFLQAQGKRDEAEASLRQAIETARNQQAKSWELRAAISLARLWQAQGKLDEAKQLLAPIYGWFTEGFDTPDLNAAREILQT